MFSGFVKVIFICGNLEEKDFTNQILAFYWNRGSTFERLMGISNHGFAYGVLEFDNTLTELY